LQGRSKRVALSGEVWYFGAKEKNTIERERERTFWARGGKERSNLHFN